jgi:hypothetical protein
MGRTRATASAPHRHDRHADMWQAQSAVVILIDGKRSPKGESVEVPDRACVCAHVLRSGTSLGVRPPRLNGQSLACASLFINPVVLDRAAAV